MILKGVVGSGNETNENHRTPSSTNQSNTYPRAGLLLHHAMSEDDDGLSLPPMLKAFQQATESATRSQQEMFQQLLTGATGGSDRTGLAPQLGSMSQMAMFKTRVQSGGRISIPDAEREALDIQEGDIVQTVVVPVKRNRSDSDE